MLNCDLFSCLDSGTQELNYDNKKKELGQIFTPKWVVELILDEVGYVGCIFNKKILEPSCGDGVFLCAIVKRYIENALKNNIDMILIKKGLENNILGIEIDKYFFEECIKNLNKVAENYNIRDINWKILNKDALKHNFKEKFDFIVGNPPYVRVHNLDTLTRNFLKNNYSFCCEGSTDLYYAFYEKAIIDIKNNGKIAFITPNSFMKNASGKTMRNYILGNNLLNKLINFQEFQVFNTATVYSAIMILSKNNDSFEYCNFINNKIELIKKINYNDVGTTEWNFSNNQKINFLKKADNNIKVQNGFATLCDKLYITDKIEEIDNKYILFNGEKIEKSITKPIVKANRYNGEEIKTRIIFPYENLNSKNYEVIASKQMIKKFPFCYEYFLKNKELFLNRDLDKNWKEWYQFGRSQSIQNIHQKKIVINNIIKDSVRFFELNSEIMVYSGLYIISNNIDYIRERLSSQDFIDYVKIVGKDMRGGYKSFTSKNLSNFLNMEI